MAARWMKLVHDVGGTLAFWTVPAGVTKILVEMCGGGGGGGGGHYGASLTAQGLTEGGGGGGAAEMVQVELDVIPGESIQLACASGGAGGNGGIRSTATAATDGAKGGASSVTRVTGAVLLAQAPGAGPGSKASVTRGTARITHGGEGCNHGTDVYAYTANTHALKRPGNGGWANSSGHGGAALTSYPNCYGYNGSWCAPGLHNSGANGYSGGGGGGGGAPGPFGPVVDPQTAGNGGAAGTSANVGTAGTDGEVGVVPGGGGGGGGAGGSAPAGFNGGNGGAGGRGLVVIRWLE